MAESSTITSSGTSITGLLGVAFVVLKLMGIITWSWWWVTAPFWAPITVVGVLFGIAALGVGIVAGVLALKENRDLRIRRSKNRKRLGR